MSSKTPNSTDKSINIVTSFKLVLTLVEIPTNLATFLSIFLAEGPGSF